MLVWVFLPSNVTLFQHELTLCFLFLPVEGGQVHIRDWRTQGPQTDLKRKSQIFGALKTRLCWFHTHHPDGCPLSSKDCVFAHGPDDLRPSTRPLKKHRSWPWTVQRTFVFIFVLKLHEDLQWFCFSPLGQRRIQSYFILGFKYLSCRCV